MFVVSHSPGRIEGIAPLPPLLLLPPQLVQELVGLALGAAHDLERVRPRAVQRLAPVGLKLSMAVRERIQQVGFVLVILLMVFVLTNDILKQVSISRGSSSTAPAAPPK